MSSMTRQRRCQQKGYSFSIEQRVSCDAVLRAAAAAPDLLLARREAIARGLIGAARH